jgi:hypothetical protein
MSLLEPEENEDELIPDDGSGTHLFETQQRSSKSVQSYLKRFLPVGVVAVLVLAGIIWLMQPGIGDPIAVSTELKQAVDDYMQANEKRAVSEKTFYKCNGYYWVKILAEPRSYPPSVRDDPVNQYRLEVHSSDGKTAQIKTLPAPVNASNKPCDTGS